MKRDSRLLSAGLLLLVAVVIAIFSYNTIWLGDDITFAYNISIQDQSAVIESFSDLIVSQNAHYFSGNGRYIAHVIVQAFCGLWGHLPFAIANGLAYICFFLMLFRLCGVSLRNFRSVATVVLLALLTFQTKTTPSCQVGYIWTFTLTMAFLNLFFRGKYDYKWWQLIPLAIFCIIAGNGQEALNLGVSGALIIYWCTNMRKFTLAQYLMMVAFGLGTLIICLSPASQSRAADMHGHRLSDLICGYLMLPFVLRTTYILFAIVIKKCVIDKLSLKQLYKENAFYWNAWFILLVFNLIIGIFCNRQLFGMELMALILSMRLLARKRIGNTMLCVAGVLLLLLYVQQWRLVSSQKEAFNWVERQYVENNDGKVFIDGLPKIWVPFDTKFTPTLSWLDSDIYDKITLNKYLHTKYPERPECRILPTFLKGKENEPLKSQIVPTSRPGEFLLIKNKNDTAVFAMHRTCFIPLFDKFIENYTEIELTPDLLCTEGKEWVAQCITINYNNDVLDLLTKRELLLKK